MRLHSNAGFEVGTPVSLRPKAGRYATKLPVLINNRPVVLAHVLVCVCACVHVFEREKEKFHVLVCACV